MDTPKSTSPQIDRFYVITLEGKIDPSWSEWLGDMRIVSRREPDGMLVTDLSGFINDQPALRGLLNRLWDLNLVLRSIQRIDPVQISDPSFRRTK